MAWDLWESPYDEDIFDSGYGSGHETHYEQQFGFSFGYEPDIIEENAINERCCIQALRTLITQADTEIDELEQSLLSLQAELCFLEDEEWAEMFSKALRDKIDELDKSMKSLKNKSENHTELEVLTYEPAEKLEVILKALMRKHFEEREKQPPQVINLESNSDALANAIELSEGTERSELVSDVCVQEAPGETNDTPEGICEPEDSSLKLQEKKTNCPNQIKGIDEQPGHTNTVDLSPYCFILPAGSSHKENITESGGQVEAVEEEPKSIDVTLIEDASLRHDEEGSVEEAQTAEAIIEASSSVSIMLSSECSSVVKSSGKSDINPNTEVSMGEMKENPTTTADLHCEKDQARYENASNAIVEYTSLETFIQSLAVNARKASSESNSSTSGPEMVGDNDAQKKLVEFPKESSLEEGITDSKIGEDTIEAEKLEEPEFESQKAIQTLQDPVEKKIVESDSQSNITTEPGLGEPGIEKSQKLFIAFDNSHLNASLKPQSQTGKRKPHPDSQSIKGQNCPPVKKKGSATSMSTYKRRKEDSGDESNTSIKHLASGKQSKKLTRLEPSSIEHGTFPVVIDPPPQPPGGDPNLPPRAYAEELTIDLDFPGTQTNPVNGGLPGFKRPGTWTLIDADSPRRILMQKKVAELKAIARQHNLKSYSKLNKNELIKFILEKVASQTF